LPLNAHGEAEDDNIPTYFFFIALFQNALLLPSLLLLMLREQSSVSIETLDCRIALAKTRLKLYAGCFGSCKLTLKGCLRKGGI
jgi:hypothetical protein